MNIAHTAELQLFEVFDCPGGGLRARGAIYSDSKKRFADGEIVMTSRLIKPPGDGYIHTLNSVYKIRTKQNVV